MRLKNHPEIKELRDLPIRAAELGALSEEDRDVQLSLLETLGISKVMGTVKELMAVLNLACEMASIALSMEEEEEASEEETSEPMDNRA